jgi:phosphate starvation-inducible protein PhoH and related proteins
LTDTIINLETVNPIEFFGVNNGKLDILKKKFPLLKILSRGTQLKLSGAPEQITNWCSDLMVNQFVQELPTRN